MTDNIYCTVSEQKQANLAIERMRLLGYQSEDVIVINKASELENLIHGDSDTGRSTLLGAVYGFVAGVLLGVAQLAYFRSGIWSAWDAFMMPLLSGLGWSLVGMIVGCSGMLVSKKMPSRVEHLFERKFDSSKLVLTVPVQNHEKVPAVCALLKEIGAADIYCPGDVV